MEDLSIVLSEMERPNLLGLNSDTEDSIFISNKPFTQRKDLTKVTFLHSSNNTLEEAYKVLKEIGLSIGTPLKEVKEYSIENLLEQLKYLRVELNTAGNETKPKKNSSELWEKEEFFKTITAEAKNMVTATRKLHKQHEEVLEKLNKVNTEYNITTKKCQSLDDENQRLKEEISNLNKKLSDLDAKVSIMKVTMQDTQKVLSEVMQILNVNGGYKELIESAVKIEKVIKVIPRIQVFINEVHLMLKNVLPEYTIGYENALKAIHLLSQHKHSIESLKEELGIENDDVITEIVKLIKDTKEDCELYKKV